MTPKIRRRTFLVGAAAAAAGCAWPPAREGEYEATARRLLSEGGRPVVLARALRSGEIDVSSLRSVAIDLATRRCIPDGTVPFGSVSHALLGAHAATRLASVCSSPTRALLWATEAWLIAREVDRSPYGITPWELPEEVRPTLPLADAVRGGDVAGADAAAGQPESLQGLCELATEEFGHLGHSALFVAAAAGLGGVGPSRCAARYMASHRRPDDTAARLAAGTGHYLKLVSDGGSDGGAILIRSAVELIAQAPRVDFSNLHIFTSAAALCDLAVLYPAALLAGAAWLDAVVAGTTELGELPGSASKATAGRAAGRPVAGGEAFDMDGLVTAALLCSRATVHHSVKLLAAASQRREGLNLAVEYLAASADTPDPEVEAAREVLAL